MPPRKPPRSHRTPSDCFPKPKKVVKGKSFGERLARLGCPPEKIEGYAGMLEGLTGKNLKAMIEFLETKPWEKK